MGMRDTIVYFGKKVSKKQFFILVILYLFTFYLWFGHDPITEFKSSDGAFTYFLTLTMLKRHIISLPLSGSLIAGIFSFSQGSYPVFLLLYIRLLDFLKIPLTPFILKLPSYLLASTVPILFFLITRLLCSPKISLLASIFICIWPFALFISRVPTGYQTVFKSSFFLLSIISLLRYFDTKSKRALFIFSCIFALYLSLSPIGFAFVPVLFYSLFIFDTNREAPIIYRIKELLKKMTLKELWLTPIVMLSPHFLAFLYGKIFVGEKAVTYFGKLLSRANVPYNFKMNNFINSYIVKHVGIIFSIFLLCGILYGIYTIIVRSKESIFFISAVCFILPFGFILGIKDYPAIDYLNEGLYCCLLLSFFLLNKIYQKKKQLTFSILICLTFYASLGVVSAFNVNNLWLRRIKPGLDYVSSQSNGQTAAGYYVRENIPMGKNIFTDMEPIYANYYFGRAGLFNLNDAGLEQNLEYFNRVRKKIDYAIISSETAKDYEFEKKGFFKVAEVYDEDGRELISVFCSERSDKMNIFDNKTLIKAFYRKYANLQNIVPYKMRYLQVDNRL